MCKRSPPQSSFPWLHLDGSVCDGATLRDIDNGQVTAFVETAEAAGRLKLKGSRTPKAVLQNFNLLPRANAFRNVMLPLSYRSMSDKQRNAQVNEALSKVGLSDRIDHIPSQLSGGEQQRVAIARALVGGPSVILADEPTGNLDTKTGQEIVELLFELSKQGQTVIMVTHDPRLLEYADRVVSMIDGYVKEELNNSHRN